ncbi:MAG: hypothetical protein WBI53_03800 [Paludibacter sp.]
MTELKFGMTKFQFGKPEFHSGSRSFIWDDGVPTPSIFSNSVHPNCRNQNYSQLPKTELLPSVVTVGSGIPKLPESEFRHPVSIPFAGNGVPIWDEVVLFGKPKFHFRCRSSIRDDGVPTPSILVIGI